MDISTNRHFFSSQGCLFTRELTVVNNLRKCPVVAVRVGGGDEGLAHPEMTHAEITKEHNAIDSNIPIPG